MTQEFLNEEKLPFKDCTREQQHILLEALLDGKLEYWPGLCSEFREICNLQLNFIYRTKPVKRLAIPWEHIKPEYRWAALNESGNLNLHASKPKISHHIWLSYDLISHQAALKIDIDGISWRDSLVERPADK